MQASFGLQDGGGGTLAADPTTSGVVHGVRGNHGGGTIDLVKKTVSGGAGWVRPAT